MTTPYQPEPGCSAMQAQLTQQLADARREVRTLEDELGHARRRNAELQKQLERSQSGAVEREALLTEARDLLEPWGGHGDGWPSLAPAINELTERLREMSRRAIEAEQRAEPTRAAP